MSEARRRRRKMQRIFEKAFKSREVEQLKKIEEAFKRAEEQNKDSDE